MMITPEPPHIAHDSFCSLVSNMAVELIGNAYIMMIYHHANSRKWIRKQTVNREICQTARTFVVGGAKATRPNCCRLEWLCRELAGCRTARSEAERCAVPLCSKSEATLDKPDSFRHIRRLTLHNHLPIPLGIEGRWNETEGNEASKSN